MTDIEIYNEIVQQRFPDVRIIPTDKGFVIALGIAPEWAREFSDFEINELPDLLRARGIEYWGVMPYSVEATKTKYPEIWKEISLHSTNV